MVLGYCTNVHAGRDWATTRANLERYAAAVKALHCPERSLPVGLWLSHASVMELTQRDGENELRALLARLGLEAFTFNGFPYGDFHAGTVKHAVYEPTWDQPERAAYTLALARLHAAIAAGPCERSISTLPLGWGDPSRAMADLDAAMYNLRMVAEQLAAQHEETGVLVHVDIEPEPGCIVETSGDVVGLFERLLRGTKDETIIRRHLRVCHDICHAAVMFEDQTDVLAKYRSAGIKVGKVQISSALRLDLRGKSDRERVDAIANLKPFAEDRYLHQTVIEEGDVRTYFEDLPLALEQYGRSDRAGDEWRVHYHLPVFLERAGELGTTQAMINQCLAAIEPDDEVNHYEVETYTWEVLPGELRAMGLAEGIARELGWVGEHL
jgi:sugar phosphate isomerase/epimerase